MELPIARSSAALLVRRDFYGCGLSRTAPWRCGRRFGVRYACSCEAALGELHVQKNRPPAALAAATARGPAGPALALAGGPRLPLRRGSAPRNFAGRSCTTSPSAKSTATRTSTTPQSLARGRHGTRPCPRQLQRLKHHALESRQEYKRLVVAPSIFPGDLSLLPLIQVYKPPDARRATGTRTSRRSSPTSSSSSSSSSSYSPSLSPSSSSSSSAPLCRRRSSLGAQGPK